MSRGRTAVVRSVPGLFCILYLLLATTASAGDALKLIAERHSLTGTWRTYRQVVDGLEVYGTDVVERVDADGSVHELHRSLARAAARRPLIAATQARAHLPAGRVARQDLAAVNVNGEARPVWRVVVEERPMEPVAHFVDAATGELLRSEALYWNAKARVFDVNPVAKLNRPDLQDQNNAASAVPDAAYSDVDLDNLPASGPLVGPNVSIVDTQAPFTVHADASQPLLFDRSQPQFEEVNAYFQLDRAQKYLQSLGYTGIRRIVDYSTPVDPHAANGLDNSYYISNATNGTGALFFGDGGTDDAEDSDIMLHEYGHAIQDWIAPGAFSGESSAQSRAMGEGFGDYWSFSSTYDATAASGRDPFCIADWDARCAKDDSSQNCAYALNADCLRRVDSTKTMTNFIVSNSPGTEHLNGEIWSSALREIFLSAGKRVTDTLVLESMFGVPPNPTYAAVALRMLDVDRALYGGAHASAICGAMTSRGILAGCNAMPRGELTVIQAPAHGLPLPATSTLTVTDTRTIDKLYVHVDIQHPSRGDLQILLTGPDGTTIALQRPSLDRSPDLHGTFGVDIEPADALSAFSGKPSNGTWTLTVTDTRSSGVGTLVSWSLEIQFAGTPPPTSGVRPFSFAARQHIVAVAHTDGAAGSQWRSDLFLFNRAQSTANVTMLFTPTGADGSTNFGEVNVEVGPQQVVAFRDVVAQLFRTTGTGTIELQGDVQELLATSHTLDVNANVGEEIEAVSSSNAMGVGDDPHYLTGFVTHALLGNWRTNVGVIETAGESGTVRFEFYDILRRLQLTRDVDVQPFTHVQLNLALPDASTSLFYFAKATVVFGAARVQAYGSQVDPTGDPHFLAPQQAHATRVIAPAVATIQSIGRKFWITGRWIDYVLPGNPHPNVTETYFDASGNLLSSDMDNGGSFGAEQIANGRGSAIFDVPAGFIVRTRTLAQDNEHAVGDEEIPIPISETLASGDSADMIRIESDTAYRTNLGATEATGGAAIVRFTLFDSSGKRLGSSERFLGPHQSTQFWIGEITSAAVLDGRVHVEIIAGDGRVAAFTSVVNNATSDAEFVRAR